MKVYFKFILLILPFFISFEVFAAVGLTLVKGMSFGDQVAGQAATVVVAPTDTGAAVLNATGMKKKSTATCSYSNSVTLTNGGGGAANSITISAFNVSGINCAGTVVPAGGQINNIGLGATANISATNNMGSYTGSATFTLVAH